MELTSPSTILLPTKSPKYDLRTKQRTKPTPEPHMVLNRFRASCFGLLKYTTNLLNTKDEGPWTNTDTYWTTYCTYAAMLAANCLGVEVPANTWDEWGDLTRPELDLVAAKLVRFSSNLCAVAMANPDTCLDSNMDFDLKQYIMFLHMYCELRGADYMKICEESLL